LPKKTLGAAALVSSLGIVGGMGTAAATSGVADAAPIARSTPVQATATAAVVHTTATHALAAVAPRTYTVRSGDTLTIIAQRFKTTVWELADANHIADINLIYAGQVLQIPSATTYYAPATTTSYTTSYRTPTYQATSYQGGYSGYSPSGVWACIARFESGGNPAEDTGNGYYGMFQFSMSSWEAVGGVGNPADASAAQQLAAAQRLQSESGWGNWPVTSRECGA
jgi:LysM repeat protein